MNLWNLPKHFFLRFANVEMLFFYTTKSLFIFQRNHSFSIHAKFSKKLTVLIYTLIRKSRRAYQRKRNFSFSENFASALHEWVQMATAWFSSSLTRSYLPFFANLVLWTYSWRHAYVRMTNLHIGLSETITKNIWLFFHNLQDENILNVTSQIRLNAVCAVYILRLTLSFLVVTIRSRILKQTYS